MRSRTLRPLTYSDMRNTLLAVVVGLPLLTSCDTLRGLSQASLSPQEVAQLDEYTARIAQQEQIIAGLEQQVVAVSKQTIEEIKDGDTAEIATRLSLLLDVQEAHEAAVAEYRQAIEEERQILSSGTKKVTDGFLAVAAPFIPAPFQPLLPFASSLMVLALSTRARKHAGKALAATAKGALGDALSSALKAVGAKHTSETPDDLLKDALTAAQAAYAKGDISIEKLEAVKAAAKVASEV